MPALWAVLKKKIYERKKFVSVQAGLSESFKSLIKIKGIVARLR